MFEEDYYEGQLNAQYIEYLRNKRIKEQDRLVQDQDDEFWRKVSLSELKDDE